MSLYSSMIKQRCNNMEIEEIFHILSPFVTTKIRTNMLKYNVCVYTRILYRYVMATDLHKTLCVCVCVCVCVCLLCFYNGRPNFAMQTSFWKADSFSFEIYIPLVK